MEIACPECGETLELLDGDDMTGWERRYRCRECQIDYVRDVSGLVVEVDD